MQAAGDKVGMQLNKLRDERLIGDLGIDIDALHLHSQKLRCAGSSVTAACLLKRENARVPVIPRGEKVTLTCTPSDRNTKEARLIMLTKRTSKVTTTKYTDICTFPTIFLSLC
ncbi:jg23569 [Pararge aegeria aegeria]|uniref:Jg23569 protein n=1 Tax=Pararge aegeria aegeria TaxID=348720 RepID=A0A8S4RXJ9_9NEOP|nr:jg23569 [Pararge aegeria aegeria]